MRLLIEHSRATLLQLLRTPAYSVITMLLPAVIFVFIGTTTTESRKGANVVMASFAIFAALGVAFFQFGVGIASQRESPWEKFARVLPVEPAIRFGATVVAATIFATVAVAFVVAVALILTDVGMIASSWLRLFASVLGGAIPMALFGIAIGYWAPSTAALPVANIFYLALSFGGGLFVPPSSMPGFLDAFSRVLPTRHIGELAWASVLDLPWPGGSWIWLLGYTIAFGGLAVAGYRRDEGIRYR